MDLKNLTFLEAEEEITEMIPLMKEVEEISDKKAFDRKREAICPLE